MVIMTKTGKMTRPSSRQRCPIPSKYRPRARVPNKNQAQAKKMTEVCLMCQTSRMTSVAAGWLSQVSKSKKKGRKRYECSRITESSYVTEIKALRAEVYAKSQAEAKLNAESDELEAVQNEVLRLRNEINDLKADAKSRAEETGADQDELRRLRDAIETKNGEISRLQRELTAAATTTAQEHIPDYIVKPRDICDDRVAFGSEDEGKAIILQQVSEALSNRDGRTIELAKRWSDAGKSPEEIDEGLVNFKLIENKRKG
eukprot:scaffold2512_cov78-Skeletonema_dohrnii-CCMP3373.AAC.6